MASQQPRQNHRAYLRVETNRPIAENSKVFEGIPPVHTTNTRASTISLPHPQRKKARIERARRFTSSNALHATQAFGQSLPAWFSHPRSFRYYSPLSPLIYAAVAGFVGFVAFDAVMLRSTTSPRLFVGQI